MSLKCIFQVIAYVCPSVDLWLEQDQGIAIVYELCEANKLKQVQSEMQAVCILLLQITEMALYLEFCVSQICGIRPVLGRVEDFSKELKLLMRGIIVVSMPLTLS